MEFISFRKIPRLSKGCIITEKLDGTNGIIFISSKEQLGIPVYEIGCNTVIEYQYNVTEQDFINDYCLGETKDLCIFAGSRNRWLKIGDDNYGFASWVKENTDELFKLGEGRHFGEWMGKGIGRNYGLQEKRFALFNVGRWHKIQRRLTSIDYKTKEEKYTEQCPSCCDVVPVLYEGLFTTEAIESFGMESLRKNGSYAVPGYMKPEGVVVYHKASGCLFKKTFEDTCKNEISN